ncbi:MAG: hypothetical protein MI976_02240 [Pseudomonadales bacterium]|nr:hypothetical protein [Pseudomonadales bacterium]
MRVLQSVNRAVNRFFSKLIRYPLLGAFASFIIGLAVNIYFEVAFADTERAIIAGLLAAILSEMVLLTNQTRLNEDVMSTLRENVDLLDDSGSVSNFIAIKQLASLKSGNEHIKVINSGINVIEPYVPDFWTMCIAHIEKELKVATYIDIESWWEDDSSRNNLLIQEFKATIQKPNVRIQRTFVYDPVKDDLKRLAPIALAQAIQGIDVSYIGIDEVQVLVKKYRLPTENMHLIDQKWVGYHMLNDDRTPLNFRLTKDPMAYNAALSFFSELEQRSKSFVFASDKNRDWMIERKRSLLLAFRERLLKDNSQEETFEHVIRKALDNALDDIGESKSKRLG